MTDEKPDKAKRSLEEERGAGEVRKAKKTYSLDDDALYSVALAKAKRDSCRLRYDLERLGMLTKDDRLWALLAEKEEEIDAKLFGKISQLGKGSAK